jgi:peptidoglycan/xylan/chitin deacetylase (PgdA/CDA1 family)
VTPRWALKRATKWAMEWGMTLSGAGALYRRTAGFRRGYRILTYHGISDSPESSFALKTGHFRDHMAYLADHHEVVGLAELFRRISDGHTLLDEPAVPPAVAVTFDDGYKEMYTVVCEILERHRIPATFFVITDTLDREDRRYISWDEARAMARAGFSIGSHTVSHRSLGALSPKEVAQELETSRDRIAHELGAPPEGLSYPYGTLRDFSDTIARTAADSGYQYAVTAVHGLNHPGCDPFVLRRTSLTAGDGLRTFRMILNGCLDPWFLVDRLAYRWQRSYKT